LAHISTLWKDVSCQPFEIRLRHGCDGQRDDFRRLVTMKRTEGRFQSREILFRSFRQQKYFGGAFDRSLPMIDGLYLRQDLHAGGKTRCDNYVSQARSLLAAASRHEDDDWVCRLLGHNGQRRWKLFFYLFDLVNLRLSIFFQSCARQRRRVIAKIGCVEFLRTV